MSSNNRLLSSMLLYVFQSEYWNFKIETFNQILNWTSEKLWSCLQRISMWVDWHVDYHWYISAECRGEGRREERGETSIKFNWSLPHWRLDFLSTTTPPWKKIKNKFLNFKTHSIVMYIVTGFNQLVHLSCSTEFMFVNC